MKFIVKCHKRTVVVAVSRTHITIWYNMTLIHSFLNESVSYCIILWCVFLKQQQQPGEVTGFQVLLDSLHPRTTTVFLFLAFPDFQCGLGLPEANLGYFRRRFSRPDAVCMLNQQYYYTEIWQLNICSENTFAKKRMNYATTYYTNNFKTVCVCNAGKKNSRTCSNQNRSKWKTQIQESSRRLPASRLNKHPTKRQRFQSPPTTLSQETTYSDNFVLILLMAIT